MREPGYHTWYNN